MSGPRHTPLLAASRSWFLLQPSAPQLPASGKQMGWRPDSLQPGCMGCRVSQPFMSALYCGRDRLGVAGGSCACEAGSWRFVAAQALQFPLSLSFHSLKLECEKLATEKTEIQRHYVMVSAHLDRAGGSRLLEPLGAKSPWVPLALACVWAWLGPEMRAAGFCPGAELFFVSALLSLPSSEPWRVGVEAMG